MRILFDHSTPAPLRHALTTHVIVEAVERGWEMLENGALLDAAEAEGFEIFVTADKNIRYQQNLAGRRLAIVVLKSSSNRLEHLRQYFPAIALALEKIKSGEIVQVGSTN